MTSTAPSIPTASIARSTAATATDTLEPIADNDGDDNQPTHVREDRPQPAQAGSRRHRGARRRAGRRRRRRRRRTQDGVRHRRRTAAGGGHARRFGRGRSRFRGPDHLRARHRCPLRRHRHLRWFADRRRARPVADPDHRRPDPRGLDHRDHRRRGAGRARPEPGGLQAVGRPVPRDPGGRPRRHRRHPLQRKRFGRRRGCRRRCSPPPRPSATSSPSRRSCSAPRTPSIPAVDHPAEQRTRHHRHPRRDHHRDRRGRGRAAGRPDRSRTARSTPEPVHRDPAGLRRARTRSPTR